MLRAIIVGGRQELRTQLEMIFQHTGRFESVRSVSEYPEDYELERVLRAHAPQVVFLCVDNLDKASRARELVERTVAGVPVVAFAENASQQVLLELMKMAVREFLPSPFQPAQAMELADRIEDHLAKNPLAVEATDLMLSFLPSKPGVGTSTLALNTSVALSRQDDTKVLLADFDLNSGLISFMLKLNPGYTIVDAVMRCEDLDENLWPQLVTDLGDLHVLPGGRTAPGIRIEPAQIHRMLDFARRQYGVICVDLSGNMEKYSVELMMESKRILLVTTPEIPPLHLARERFNFLRELDLGDRVSILLNRWSHKSSISKEQIEDLLEAPVYETFPNSYNGVHKALVAGQPIDPKSELGQCFATLANRIMHPGAPKPDKPKKRFLESFSILSSKYSVER